MASVISGQHIDKEDYNTAGRSMGYLTGPSDFGPIHPLVTKWTEKPKDTAKAGDILVTVKGSGVGSVNLMNGDELAISRQLMAIRANSRLVNPGFVYLVVLGKQEHFNAQASGAAIPGITRDDVLDVEIPLPSLPEQTRIVAELDAVAARIEAVRGLIPAFAAKIQRVLARGWATGSADLTLTAPE